MPQSHLVCFDRTLCLICKGHSLGVPKERAVQGEGLQVPQLDGFVSSRSGKLLAVWRNEALQDVGGMRAQLMQRLKVRGVSAACMCTCVGSCVCVCVCVFEGECTRVRRQNPGNCPKLYYE